MQKLFLLTIFSLIFFMTACKTEHGSHDHSHTEETKTVPKNQAGYKVELKTEPSKISDGEQVKLMFTVKNENGEPVKDLEIVHEKLMHLLIVSEDLGAFHHEHPEQQADGTFKLDFTFRGGGKYRLYADLKPKGANGFVEQIDVTVAGEVPQRLKLTPYDSFKITTTILTYEMKTDMPITAGRDTILDFYFTENAKNNQPVTDLENYLGEKAHFVIISEDLKEFVHAHPMKGGKDQKATVSAHVKFPKSGIYKIWVQYQRNGIVVSVPFVVDVKAGGESKTTAEAKIPDGFNKIVVDKNGFTPAELKVPAGRNVKLAFLRTDEENCGDEIVLKDYEIRKKLPLGEVVTVEIDKVKSAEITFACGMDMLKGKILVQ